MAPIAIPDCVALIDDGFQTHKCIYNIAYAYYKLGKLRQSRLFCERLLKLDPLNQQAQDLHQQLDAVVQQSGALVVIVDV